MTDELLALTDQEDALEEPEESGFSTDLLGLSRPGAASLPQGAARPGAQGETASRPERGSAPTAPAKREGGGGPDPACGGQLPLLAALQAVDRTARALALTGGRPGSGGGLSPISPAPRAAWGPGGAWSPGGAAGSGGAAGWELPGTEDAWSAQRLDRIFRQDSRRYDQGFALY